mgnify:CR=1 FL=1
MLQRLKSAEIEDRRTQSDILLHIVDATVKHDSIEMAKKLHQDFKTLFNVDRNMEQRDPNFQTVKMHIETFERHLRMETEVDRSTLRISTQVSNSQLNDSFGAGGNELEDRIIAETIRG